MSSSSPPEQSEVVAECSLPRERITEPRTGWLAGINEQRRLLVDFAGNAFGPLRARTTLVLDEPELQRAIAERCAVLLLFEEGDPARPIVVGLLHDKLPTAPPAPTKVTPVEVEADGRRVEVEAQDEIVLRCGEASITLRRNGRVHIRGTYVETRSKGVNRIKGGSVAIN